MGIYRSFGARVLKIVSETCGAGSLTEKASVDEVSVENRFHLPTHLPTTKVDASVCHNYTAFSYYFYGGYLCQEQACVAGQRGPSG